MPTHIHLPRPFSTAARVHPAVPPYFYHPHSIPPRVNMNMSKMPKVGRLGRLYLPTMALILLGAPFILPPFITLRHNPFTAPFTLPSPTTDQNQHNPPGFAAYNALEEANHGHLSESERSVRRRERNEKLLDAYGERMSLSDVEKALEVYEVQ
ncbi:hypothetical protein K432DRAFT_402488 [Lepidopterella palustris CBS 459.81]|uniref:Uncharacterized protein n=1 Tax=Lepidopterella palustris CBS 459.81 TaxID=1314670 RepID=A0A8E2JHL5_9PEZI|nr:hypothetical protein K432DRAFT_402488 [Lepidopterella palustris CBS 459.81]